jgi:predicted tellurium resistance membrane protein TerC
MDWLSDPNAWAALLTLTALEIVLGIDNIIFISILAAKLPVDQQQRARTIGLAVAMVSRLMLLASLNWIMHLREPLFAIAGKEISGRDLILLVGGLFLMWKSTHEIHQKVEGEEDGTRVVGNVTFAGVIGQIMVLDIVFSLDSVITAVGMADRLAIMVMAVVISVGIMMLAAGRVSHFVETHPTVKMLALAFLLMIGISLVAEGWSFHIPKGYIYFAMAFSICVEMLNIRVSRKASKS